MRATIHAEDLIMVKIVIDMMGGDNGYAITIEAVKNFLKEHDDCEIIAVGDEKVLEPIKDIVKIIPSQSILPMECGVMQAMRQKDSSCYKAISAVNEEKADGVLSAGSTGAFLSLATLINKKIPGIERPALISPFPTRIPGKNVVLLDVGATSDNSPEDLYQFAKMGEAYYKAAYGEEAKNINLVCNGTEEGKGNDLTKKANALLKQNPHYTGYIEARHVLDGECDVCVFDGFTGNIFLKGVEGVAKMMGGMMKEAFTASARSKIGYLFAKKSFKPMIKLMDYKRVGGALLIGVNTVAVKAHGNSDAYSFGNALTLTYTLAKNKMVDQIKQNL